LVLFAQKQAIEQIRPGKLWSNIQLTIVEILVQGLIDLKILSGNLTDLIDQQAYKEFYMHGSGHFLGLDVHDVGSYTINQKSRALVPGMVLTVEPGLYFPPNSKNIVDQKWQGMGIRIEDDILVTKKGFEVLTSAAVKEMDEIENLMLN
ncbi:MAG: M24 family metallopeptidase, partial [Gammaproteobacteria bacterium]